MKLSSRTSVDLSVSFDPDKSSVLFKTFRRSTLLLWLKLGRIKLFNIYNMIDCSTIMVENITVRAFTCCFMFSGVGYKKALYIKNQQTISDDMCVNNITK
jgi:hypothetical protein